MTDVLPDRKTTHSTENTQKKYKEILNRDWLNRNINYEKSKL